MDVAKVSIHGSKFLLQEVASVSHNWREIPADLVEEAITYYNNSKYPPTFEEMVAIAARFRFVVWLTLPRVVPTASTDHQRGVIVVPYMDDIAIMEAALLHELAHLLLRLPVAPEIRYEPTDQDEHHAVASIVHERMFISERSGPLA